MSNLVIRSFEPSDEPDLLSCWQRAMTMDPIAADEWRVRFLLDPNFRRDNVRVACIDRQLVGFVLGMRDRSDQAWVVAFGVNPEVRRQGIGSSMLSELLERWRRDGIRLVHFGPYMPSYIVPGIDVAAYSVALALAKKLGAVERERELSMKANLTGHVISPEIAERQRLLEQEGFAFRAAEPFDMLPLLEFAEDNFGPAWRYDIATALQELFVGDPRRVTIQVVTEHGEIVGYAQSRNERFGPFGIHERLRGQGIGGVALEHSLQAMRRRGFHTAWFMWTSDRTAKLYREHEFEEVRRWAMCSLEL